MEKPLEWGGEPYTHNPQPAHPQWEASPVSVSPSVRCGLSPKGSSFLSTFEGLAGLTLPENVRGGISLWRAVVCL